MLLTKTDMLPGKRKDTTPRGHVWVSALPEETSAIIGTLHHHQDRQRSLVIVSTEDQSVGRFLY